MLGEEAWFVIGVSAYPEGRRKKKKALVCHRLFTAV